MRGDSGGMPVVTRTVRTGFARWRQRVAGLLLALGGLASLVSLLLPWTYAYVPHAPSQCSCGPYTRTPLDGFGTAWHSGQNLWLPAVWTVLLVGLPLMFVVVGARLLTRREALRLRWRLIILLASVLAFLVFGALAFIIGLTYIDAAALTVQTQPGETVALLAPLAPFLAGLLMPTRRERVRAAATR